METLVSLLKRKAKEAIINAFGLLEVEPEIFVCNQEEFGHYQCNNALSLAKLLKMNPRKVAEKIVEKLKLLTPFLSKIDIAGPGFINLTFSPQFLSKELNEIIQDPFLGAVKENPKKVIVEFSSPNIAKELHVGHLRSTIIGDSIANLFEFLGHDVLRLNHVGDWGTQFGMLIAFLKKFHPEVLAGKVQPDLPELTAWYKQAKKHFDENSDFKKQSQLEVVQLQKKEEKAYGAWKIICDISRRAFEEIYDLLNVKLIERGESYYNSYLQPIIDDLQKKNLITVSDGAKCIFVEGFKNREGKPLPIIAQKSDGGFNYDTTDIAAFYQRCREEKADRIIVVTDSGQSLHFQMIYQAVVKALYLDPEKTRFDHVTFGLVLGEDGRKFRTREGETEKLIDLLLEAKKRAKKVIEERSPKISSDELDRLAHVIGIGSVKYADLSSHRQRDYQFSYDRMLKFEGNTAPFLLYSYVRIQGIKRRSLIDIETALTEGKIELKHPSEISLGLHLKRFGEVAETLTKDLLPNRLTDYLYELAEKFNIFFRDCQVIETSEEKNRLVLCELTGKILKNGLNILGLQTIDRM